MMSKHMVEQLRISGKGTYKPERRPPRPVDFTVLRRAKRIPTAATAKQRAVHRHGR